MVRILVVSPSVAQSYLVLTRVFCYSTSAVREDCVCFFFFHFFNALMWVRLNSRRVILLKNGKWPRTYRYMKEVRASVSMASSFTTPNHTRSSKSAMCTCKYPKNFALWWFLVLRLKKSGRFNVECDFATMKVKIDFEITFEPAPVLKRNTVGAKILRVIPVVL